jgi:hypothetical protein
MLTFALRHIPHMFNTVRYNRQLCIYHLFALCDGEFSGRVFGCPLFSVRMDGLSVEPCMQMHQVNIGTAISTKARCKCLQSGMESRPSSSIVIGSVSAPIPAETSMVVMAIPDVYTLSNSSTF